MRVKTFLSGEYTYQVFHRIDDYSQRMRRILGEDFDIALDSEHYERFEARDYEPYDCVVMYTDQWYIKAATQIQQAQAMLHYVLMGGGLVLIHQTDMGSDYELGQMLGVRPVRPLWLSQEEGKVRPVRYEPVEDHPLAEGVAPFTLRENMFDLEYDDLAEKSVFLYACLEDGIRIPAAWSVSYGLGKAVCVCPGHESSAFDQPGYARLLRNAAKWAARRA